MDAGSIVRKTRERHGLSQTRLARRAGTSQSFVSRVEAGTISPTVETLERLLLVMGERLDVAGTTRIPGWLDDDPHQRAAARRRTPAERLEQAFAANAFAAALHGEARQ
jgi:transcriptional regulator with XRE-family HTH domain